MKRLLDHDPITGITEWFHYDEATGQRHVETVQDVEPFIELCKTLRNDEEYSKRGIKNEMWHYAKIPMVVEDKIRREHGIDINMMDQDKFFKFMQIIETDYPYLKTTTKQHRFKK